MAGSVLDETKTFFEMLVLSFTTILNRSSQAASISKTVSEKTGALICSVTCLVSRDHPFSRYTNFSEKITFLIPGVRNVTFSENFASVLNPP